MVRRLWVQAVRTPFLSSPAAPRRAHSARMTGCQRVAVRAAVYRAARTLGRPPQTLRLPRQVPLSQFRGATPTRAASGLWPSRPSSGSSASRVALTTGPIPGTLRSRSACSAPEGAAAHPPAEVLIDPVQPLAQPSEVLLDVLADGGWGTRAAALLGHEPLDELPTPGDQGGQGLGGGGHDCRHATPAPSAAATPRARPATSAEVGRSPRAGSRAQPVTDRAAQR